MAASISPKLDFWITLDWGRLLYVSPDRAVAVHQIVPRRKCLQQRTP